MCIEFRKQKKKKTDILLDYRSKLHDTWLDILSGSASNAIVDLIGSWYITHLANM